MESYGLFKGTFPLLEKALDLRALKHSVVVTNIAHKDTPNYKSFDLMVEEELEKTMRPGQNMVLERTCEGHFSGRGLSEGEVTLKADDTPSFARKRDGNTVNIDREMSKLSENNLLYNALSQIMSKKFKGLKNVIQGGQ